MNRKQNQPTILISKMKKISSEISAYIGGKPFFNFLDTQETHMIYALRHGVVYIIKPTIYRIGISPILDQGRFPNRCFLDGALSRLNQSGGKSDHSQSELKASIEKLI